MYTAVLAELPLAPGPKGIARRQMLQDEHDTPSSVWSWNRWAEYFRSMCVRTNNYGHFLQG